MINTTAYGGGYSPMLGGTQGHHHPDPSQMAQELLSAADTNGDGSISKSEFTALMQGAGKGDTAAIDKLFSTLDKNGDGSVSTQETTTAITSLFDNMRNHLLQSRGRNAAGPAPAGGDADGDGDGDRGGESGVQAGGGHGVNPRIAMLIQGLLHQYQVNQSTSTTPTSGLLSASA